MSTMSSDAVEGELIAFIRERFLSGDEANELRADTPLLEWGVLDSLKVAILLSHIRDEFGTNVPFAEISARNFKDPRSIARLIGDLSADAGTPAPGGDRANGSAVLADS